MAASARGASLDPNTHTKGGAVPDGDYLIKQVSCVLWDYNGQGPQGPAIAVLYGDPKDAAVEYTQYYSAGKIEFLVPSDDGKRMVHPRGEEAKYAGGSNASVWLSSVMKAGFPAERMAGDDVTVFAGTGVRVESVAQQKRGLANEKEGKTIPLVTKINSVGGKVASRPTAAKPAAATQQSAATPAATSTGNGDVSSVAIAAVLQCLSVAPDNTLKIKGLGVRAMKYTPGVNLNTLTKLLTPDWFKSHQEQVGWDSNDETVAFPGLDSDTLTAVLEAIK